jgi:hypothetical protein
MARHLKLVGKDGETLPEFIDIPVTDSTGKSVFIRIARKRYEQIRNFALIGQQQTTIAKLRSLLEDAIESVDDGVWENPHGNSDSVLIEADWYDDACKFLKTLDTEAK